MSNVLLLAFMGGDFMALGKMRNYYTKILMVFTITVLLTINLFNFSNWDFPRIILIVFFIILFNSVIIKKSDSSFSFTKRLKIKFWTNFLLGNSLIWHLGAVHNISFHIFNALTIISATIYITLSYGLIFFSASTISYGILYFNRLVDINNFLSFVYIVILALILGDLIRYYDEKSKRLDKKVKEFEALYKISKLIDSFPSTQMVLDGIAEIVAKTLEIDDCLIMLYDEEKDLLSSKASYSSINVEPQNITFSKGEGAAGKVLETLESIVSVDLVRDYHIVETFKYDLSAKACAIIPLVFNNQGIGVIAVFAKNKYEFTRDTIELLDIIASRIGKVLENDKLYKAVKMDSLTDDLTKLYNYRHFYKVLKEKLKGAIENNSNLFLLIIDVDKFKHFNDTYGHLVGDKVLREISTIIRDSIRKSDIAARYGGEEFAIILPNSDIVTARKVAERIKEKIKGAKNNIDETKDKDVEITVSIGIASYPYCAKSLMNLIKEADMRMYYGKENGGDTVVYMESSEICP